MPRACLTVVRRDRRGSVLIISLVGTMVLAFLGVTLAGIVCDEEQISTNASDADEAFYLADAGVAEVVWQVTYKKGWRDGLRTGEGWYEEFTRDSTDGLPVNRSYHVTVEGQAPGSALVTSVGTVRRGGGTAKRVVQAHIGQGLRSSDTANIFAIMATGEKKGKKQHFKKGKIEIDSKADIKGGMLAYHEVNFKKRARKGVKVDTRPIVWNSAENKFKRLDGAPFPDNVRNMAIERVKGKEGRPEIDGSKFEQDLDGTATPVDMPSLDFREFKNIADVYLTKKELTEMMKAGPVELKGIVYVEGGVHVCKKMHLKIKGLLVSDKKVEVHKKDSELTVEPNPLDFGWKNACGIVAGGDIKLKNDFKIKGLVYSLKKIELKSEGSGDRSVEGAVIGREVKLKGKETITVKLDENTRKWVQAVMKDGDSDSAAGEPTTVRIDAWAEIY